jgi:hypothetical protein
MTASPQKTKAQSEGNLAQLLAMLEANTALSVFFRTVLFHLLSPEFNTASASR